VIHRCAIVAATSLVFSAPSVAQESSFQIVSIRSAAPIWGIAAVDQLSDAPSSMNYLPGGRFEAQRVSVEDLARVAYGFERIDPRRGVVQTPRFFWAARERFDLTAVKDGEWTTPSGGDHVPPELRSMLRALLEDRFALKARIATRRVDVYALQLSDGGTGPWLRPSNEACADAPRCPASVTSSRIRADSVTTIELARILSGFQELADRPIVDDTGLTGTYRVYLLIGLDHPRSAVLHDPWQSPTDLPEPAPLTRERWIIAIREALKIQLGLELRKSKLPIPTLVIESAKRPRED
jgi:uncharacterized protein (TIGR03435 family)